MKLAERIMSMFEEVEPSDQLDGIKKLINDMINISHTIISTAEKEGGSTDISKFKDFISKAKEANIALSRIKGTDGLSANKIRLINRSYITAFANKIVDSEIPKDLKLKKMFFDFNDKYLEYVLILDDIIVGGI